AVRSEFALEKHGQAESVPCYRVFFHDQPVIQSSRLGIDLDDASALGGPCVLQSVHTHSSYATYTQFPGKRRHVVNHYTEAVVTLRERTPRRRKWQLLFRAYDDGAAFRYHFPAQEGWPRLAVAGERTEFHLENETIAYALPLNSFTTSFEGRYQKKFAA